MDTFTPCSDYAQQVLTFFLMEKTPLPVWQSSKHLSPRKRRVLPLKSITGSLVIFRNILSSQRTSGCTSIAAQIVTLRISTTRHTGQTDSPKSAGHNFD